MSQTLYAVLYSFLTLKFNVESPFSNSNNPVNTPPQGVVPPVSPVSSSPPLITASPHFAKPRKTSLLVKTIMLFLIPLIGAIAGLFLNQLNQDIRQQASEGVYESNPTLPPDNTAYRCSETGGTLVDGVCVRPVITPTPTPVSVIALADNPAYRCSETGGTWINDACIRPVITPTPTPTPKIITNAGGSCSTLTCADGYEKSPVGGSSTVCICIAAKSDNGDRCSSNSDCTSYNCLDYPGGKYCAPYGTTLSVKGKRGATCGTTSYDRTCENGLVCQSNVCSKTTDKVTCADRGNGTFVIAAISDNGSSVYTDNLCDPGNIDQQQGGSCIDDSQCGGWGSTCIENRCTANSFEDVENFLIDTAPEDPTTLVIAMYATPLLSTLPLAAAGESFLSPAIAPIAEFLAPVTRVIAPVINALNNPYVKTTISGTQTLINNGLADQICADPTQQTACNQARLLTGTSALGFASNLTQFGSANLSQASSTYQLVQLLQTTNTIIGTTTKIENTAATCLEGGLGADCLTSTVLFAGGQSPVKPYLAAYKNTLFIGDQVGNLFEPQTEITAPSTVDLFITPALNQQTPTTPLGPPTYAQLLTGTTNNTQAPSTNTNILLPLISGVPPSADTTANNTMLLLLGL